jgi:hypothetical protein
MFRLGMLSALDLADVPPQRLVRIGKFDVDRADAEYCDDDGLLDAAGTPS